MRNYILFLGFLVLGTGAFADYDSQGTYIELRQEVDTLVVCENNVAELNIRLSGSGPACNDLKQKLVLISASYNELREKSKLTEEEQEAMKALDSAVTRTAQDAKLECSGSVQISRMDSPNLRTFLILKKPFRVSEPSEWNGQICVTVNKF